MFPLKKSDSAKKRMTVLLGVLANGKKLPSYFIFKGIKPISKIKGCGKFYVDVQENVWCDSIKSTECWITVKSNEKSMLILDEAKSHLSEENAKFLIEKKSTTLNFIPGGFTRIIQPLDVSINKLFKLKIKNKWITKQINDKSERIASKKEEFDQNLENEKAKILIVPTDANQKPIEFYLEKSGSVTGLLKIGRRENKLENFNIKKNRNNRI